MWMIVGLLGVVGLIASAVLSIWALYEPTVKEVIKVCTLLLVSAAMAFGGASMDIKEYNAEREDRFVRLCEEANGVRSTVDPDVCLTPGGNINKWEER